MTTDGRSARLGLAAVTAAGAIALAAGATSSSAGLRPATPAVAPTANLAPVAALRPRHRRIRVGRHVVLDSSRSRDRDGRIVYRLWDLDGDGVFERNSGRRARVRRAFQRPGLHHVAVIVVDDGGAFATRRARVRVVGPEAADDGHRAASRIRDARPRHRPRVHAASLSRGTTSKAPTRVTVTRPPTSASPPIHKSSATNDVTIKNFKYFPKSITVSVGDTVTWTNEDSAGHTATADDGTFDTGLLSKGTSGSYTFNTAGKFTYHCTPHSGFMKGASVIVNTSGGGSSPSDSGGSSSQGESGSSGGSSSGNSSSLPHTGLEIGSVVLAGFALLGAGMALRRRLTRA